MLGIIAEYNPFHNGHKYHIQKAKELTNSDAVIVIMSGAFTQQGNIAIYDKFDRAKLATSLGADMVIELPTIYANSSSDYFAKGAISILNSLNIVDSICFGSECGDINILKNVANTIIKNEDDIWNNIKLELKNGVSFAEARQNTISKYLNTNEKISLSKPNNILGIEYIKWLIKTNSSITPYTIKREDSGFNNDTITEANQFTSATSIRKEINNNNIGNVEKYVPANTYEIIKTTKPAFNEDIYTLLKYKIISTSKQGLSNINGITEGLENRIYDAINKSNNYDEFIHNIKSKRYQMSKIKRVLVNILLDITKEDFNYINDNFVPYAHILSLSINGKLLLSKISKESDTKLVTSINDGILKKYDKATLKCIKFDILAQNIYSIANNTKINKDYTNKL